MEQTYPLPTDPTVVVISDTTQHDQLLANFVQGVQFLENQIEVLRSPEAYTPAMLSVVTQNLLNMAKPLNNFLEFLMSLQSPVYGHEVQRLQYLRNTWLRNAIAGLRIYCHRYSLAVLKISFELGEGVTSFQQDTQWDDGDVIDHMEDF